MTITDQTGYKVNWRSGTAPKRIISIVPSQSELLWDLGLHNELIGITKFCIHPGEMYRKITRVGGTKKLDMDIIRGLKPDLIIGNKEENERSQIEQLRKEFPVWMSDIYNLEDAFGMISSLGSITGKEQAALNIIQNIKQAFSDINTKAFKNKKVAYFIWYNPFMVAASNTFINFILERLGSVNVFAGLERYPEISVSQIKTARPDLILLSSEPFPFKEKHVIELKEISPSSDVMLVDGEMFSWYGSRLQYAPKYFNSFAL